MEYKLLLVGESGVGKSTWCKRLRTGEFEPMHIATIGVEVHPIRLQTNIGEVIFKVWDCAGRYAYGGLREGYYIGGDCAIIMGNNQPNEDLREHYWNKRLRSVLQDQPIHYVDRNMYNIQQPLLDMVRTLSGNDNIVLV